MNITNIKSVISSNTSPNMKDILDYKKINNIDLYLTNIETISKIKTGDIVKENVTVKYFADKIYIGEEEYSVELATLNLIQKKEFQNSDEPIFLNGILKYSPMKEIFVLTSFKKIDLFFSIDDWLSITSQLKFDEIVNEILTGLNMDTSKLLLKEKNMFITRLIPLVQSQFLLMDFSKRATRKTRTYLDLGYHIPATYNFTRAKIIYDQSQRKKGLIFKAKGECLILDEFQNNTDDGITMGIQQFKNNGTISDDKGNIMPLNTSIIILGNPKINIKYPFIFTYWQNIFEGTTIYKKNVSTGDAFLSRVDYLIPSWGSRVICKEMILKNDVKRIPPYILRSIFSQLREIDISDKVKIIINNFNFKTDIHDNRSQKAIERTFEGLIKLLVPQLIKNNNYQDYQKELTYLYNLALEGRIIVNNMLQKIKTENTPADFSFTTSSYFSKIKRLFILPHRKIYIRDNEVIKEALDTIGLLQNQEEIDILKKAKVKYIGNSFCFKHCHTLPNLFKTNFATELKDICSKHKKVIFYGGAIIGIVGLGYMVKSGKIKPKLKNIKSILSIGMFGEEYKNIVKTIKSNFFTDKQEKTNDIIINWWSDDIFFNYLIGEHEYIPYSKKDIEFLTQISFYYR